LAGIVAIYNFDDKRESCDEMLFYLVSNADATTQGKAY
jgi:hypothetical protein